MLACQGSVSVVNGVCECCQGSFSVAKRSKYVSVAKVVLALPKECASVAKGVS